MRWNSRPEYDTREDLQRLAPDLLEYYESHREPYWIGSISSYSGELLGTSYRLLFMLISIVAVVLHQFTFGFNFKICLALFISILLDNCLSACRSCVWFSFESIWTSFETVFRVEIECSWSYLFLALYLFCCFLFNLILELS